MGIDVDMAFAAGANGTIVDLGAPTHVRNPQFDPKLPGSWLADLSHVDLSRVLVGREREGLDGEMLPSPFTPNGTRPEGPAWYATPTVAYAVELGYDCAACATTGFKTDRPALTYLIIHPRLNVAKIGICNLNTGRIDRHLLRFCRMRKWEKMWLVRPPGVYAPQEDTALLEEVLWREGLPVGLHVLDVGTGTGALALAAARRGAERVVAVDISRRAVLAARVNAALSRRRVHVRRGDLLAPVVGQSFDLVLANPPYVPSPHAELSVRGPARAWDAGGDGRLLLDRLCADVPALMRPGGVFLLVHSALCGTAATLELLEAAGLTAEVAERRLVPFGPVLRSRADWLTARGVLQQNQDKEELVVIRARRPT